MTDRDHFAAAALTGLLSQCAAEDREAAETAAAAMRYADAMLRERAKTNHDAAPAAIVPEPEPSAARRRPAGGTGDTDHGAAPAARASEATASPERVRVRGDAGTGDTQEIASYRRFVGEVMNWISEATSAADWSSDGGRKILADACSRCWDAFDRIAYPTDKAAPRPSEGTGDTPVAEPATTAEPVAWGVANGSRVLATSISRMDAVDMQGDYAYHTEIVPLYREPTLTDEESDDLRMWFAECMDQSAAATDGANEELSARWLLRAHRAAVMLDRLGGER